VGGVPTPQPAGESRCEHAAPGHGRTREQQVCFARPAASDCWHRRFSSLPTPSEEAHCTLFSLPLSSPTLITHARPHCFQGRIFPHIHAVGSNVSPPHGHRYCFRFRHPILSPFPKTKAGKTLFRSTNLFRDPSGMQRRWPTALLGSRSYRLLRLRPVCGQKHMKALTLPRCYLGSPPQSP
jgi:hypothetical protein